MIFFSNRQEKLFDLLGEQLFSASSRPFEKRMVVAASPAVKSAMMQHFAKDPSLNIATGMHILTLSQALAELIVYQSPQERRKIPTHLELCFQIEHSLINLLQHHDVDHPYLSILFRYLEFTPSHPPLFAKSNKLQDLCKTLSTLFLTYGLFGGKRLNHWQKQPGWQQMLWHQAFSEETGWTFPYKELQNEVRIDFPIHLIGFHFLPKLYVDFFSRLKSIYYLLSPCALFWTDMHSDKERAFFKNSMLQEDHHPLLANMGKLARKFLNTLDEKNPLTEEHYIEPKEGPLTLLQAVQKDLLDLGSLETYEPLSLEQNDRSIQLHAASSKQREVEILYDILETILLEHKGDEEPIQPCDIHVFSPDINDYAPFIHMVFGAKDSCLDYTISDLKFSASNSFIQGFKLLLKIPSQRFDTTSMFTFFENGNFLEKFHLCEGDVRTLKKWVEETHIHSGVDQKQRDTFLLQASAQEKMIEDTNTGTWESGFDRLLLGLALFQDQPFSSTLAASNSLDLQNCELLGEWIQIIQSLAIDLKPLSEEVQWSLSSWADYLQSLATTYFKMGPEDAELFIELEQLFCSLKHLEDKPPGFGFESIQYALEEILDAKGASFQTSHVQAVHFRSLQPGSATPAKVVCLIGIEEEAFPRITPKQSLSEMKEEPSADFYPSKTEEDRMLFLEQLLSARSYFLMSYQRLSVSDFKEQSCSILALDLFSYLDKYFRTKEEALPSKALVWSHPTSSFDQQYYLADAYPKNHRPLFFGAAKALYSPKKDPLTPFLEAFHQSTQVLEEAQEKEITIDLLSLTKLSRSPLQFYFNEVLGIYFPFKKQDRSKNQFVFSDLERALVRKASLKTPLDALLKRKEAEGAMPLGSFKSAAHLRIKEDVEAFHIRLQEIDLHPEEIFSIELKQHCEEPICDAKGHWIVPALKIPLADNRQATLIGRLSDVSFKGLFYDGKNKLEDLIKRWPHFLVFQNLPFFKENKKLLLSKSGVIKESSSQTPLADLVSFLSYYELCLKNPSPLLPAWIEPLLVGSMEELEKAIQTSLSPFYSQNDAYLEWLFLRDPPPSAKSLFETWAPYLRHAFASLIDFYKSGET